MEIKIAKDSFEWTNTWHQYFATLAANCVFFAHGTSFGWTSPAMDRLISVDTPLKSGPLTNNELSWMGSINCIGSLFGAVCFGYLTTLMGVKRSMLLISIPLLSFWFLIYFGDRFEYVLTARFLSGWAGGGIQATIVLFTSEIANDNIRGRLGSISLLSRNTGTLVGYILGAYLEYHTIPYVCVFIPIVYLLLFTFLPNTPRYYLHKGDTQKAENALKYYKGYKGKSQKEEIAFYEEFERLKSIASDRKTEEKLQFSDFYNRDALKGLGIGVAMTTFVQFSACYTLVSYAVIIFKAAGASLDPHLSSIILATALICGSLATTYFADILGRKILNLISLAGSAIGVFVMALYHYLNLNGTDLSHFQWVPVVSLSLVIFLASAGIMPLSFICSVEYLPAKIRDIGMAFVAFSANATMFVFVKFFPILLEKIDLHGCMLIFGFGCIAGVIFVALVLQETKGKSLDDIGNDDKLKEQRARTERINSF